MSESGLPLLYLDDRLAVISKPAGWLVHASPLDPREQRIVLQALRNQLGRRVFPVHRLDKATSGVLAFALDADTARELGERFTEGQGIRKIYRAVVRGWPASEQLIDHPLTRLADDLTEARTQRLPSQTRLCTLERGTLPIAHGRYGEVRYAQVELEPLTGRRHQLRRHMKHIAHPILGDSTHGKGPLNRAVAEHLGVSRLWLHAYMLEICLSGQSKPIRIEAPVGPAWHCWSLEHQAQHPKAAAALAQT